MSAPLRILLARTLTVLGALILVVSVAANFVERQALDTNEFEETARQLISDDEIQAMVAATLTDELYANVDVQALLEERLPAEQQGLAGPISGALRPATERLAARLLERPRFQEVWVQAVGVAQAQVVRVLDDEARFLETEQGVVAIDLRPLLVELTDQLSLGGRIAERLPENAGVITLFETEQLETAQTLTRVLRFVAAWIWVLALLAWIGAVYLAGDRRREIRAIAIAFVVVGLVLLAIRRLAGSYLVDELAASEAQEDAVQNTWDIVTRLLADAGWAGIGLGVVAVLAVWLVGPSRYGTASRGWLAPHLRRPGVAYGVAAALFLILFVWSPVSYVQNPFVILTLAVLAAVGVELLRRQAAREFPEAEPVGTLPPPPPA